MGAATTALVAGSIAAPVVGGIIGSEQASKDRRAAQNARNQAIAQFAGINVPEVEKQMLALETPELVGEYTPEMEDFIELDPSAMEEISTDPRLQQAQMAALEQMAGLAESGLSPADIAALEEVRRGAAAEAEAKQGQILQEMQARGQGGSGAELVARLKAAQSGADRMSQEGLDIAQMVQQRALQALAQQGSLAGQLRGQEFGEKTDIARAKDIVNQFNVQQQQGLQQRNVAAQNQAALRNLSEKQRIAEQQAAIRNYQQEQNRALQQQRFQNEMNLAGGKAGQYAGAAADAQQRAAQTAQMWSGMGQGVGSGLMGAAMMGMGGASTAPAVPATTTSAAGGPALQSRMNRIGSIA